MSFVKGVRKGLSDFGHNIALVVNSALLFLVYFTAVAATAMAARIFGKHFLELKPDSKASTYWRNLGIKKRPAESHYRQF